MSDPFELLRRMRPEEEGVVPPVERLWDRLEQAPRSRAARPVNAPARFGPAGWGAAGVSLAVVAVCIAVSIGALVLLSGAGSSPTTSSTSPAARPGLKAILGVLRTPATVSDRHLGGALAQLERALRGRDTFHRREARVAAGAAGAPRIVLVPVTPAGGGPLQLATAGGGGSDCCLTAGSIERGAATSTWGGADTGNYGMIIVPDGVARVTVRIGRTLTAVVHDNVAVLRLPGPVENLGVYPMTWVGRSGAIIRRFHIHATTKAPPSHPRYPASTYPPPARRPHWGQPGACASLAGVRHPSRRDDPRASGAVLILLDDHLRAVADRAYWPVLAQGKREHLTHANVLVVGPAARSPYAGLIRTRCGAGLVKRSIRVVIGPPHSLQREPALSTEFWVLHRRDEWLVWWSQY